jgi:hypothetical protein
MRYLVVFFLLFPLPLMAQSEWVTGSATANEVYQKVTEAAEFLAETGEDGLKEFEKSNGRFVWKDTYVYVAQCEAFFCLPSPKQKVIGLNFSKAKCHKTGKIYILQLCGEALNTPRGAWVEFWWPRPGFNDPQRKVAFMRQVPDMPYQVVADIYDDTTSLAELRKIGDTD